LRTAWRPEVLRIGLVAAVGWACLGGMSFLVALRVDDEFGLSAAQRGLLLTGFGVAGLLTARLVGSVVDRIGPRRCVLVGAGSGAVLVAVVGLAPWLPVVAAAWALAGVAGQFVLVSLNALVLTGSPDNSAGAVSVVQAMRFLGGAGSPVVITPLYVVSAALGFLVPAAALAVVPRLLLRRRRAPAA
jgi:MFS family permease